MSMTHLFACGALTLTFGLTLGCEETSEAKENYDSKQTCEDYCVKKYDCADVNPTEAQSTSCVNLCRDSIEDNCGNANQDAANDKLDTCNNQTCDQFAQCVVFAEEPGCFGFADE